MAGVDAFSNCRVIRHLLQLFDGWQDVQDVQDVLCTGCNAYDSHFAAIRQVTEMREITFWQSNFNGAAQTFQFLYEIDISA